MSFIHSFRLCSGRTRRSAHVCHLQDHCKPHQLVPVPVPRPVSVATSDGLGLASQTTGLPCRFSTAHPLQLVFDWVDISSPQELKPGTYSLVTQYPRRSFSPDSTSTLQEAGLTAKQEAMFIQLQ